MPQPPPLPNQTGVSAAAASLLQLRNRSRQQGPPPLLLNLQELERFENLLVFAKAVVEGYFAGKHKSPYRGSAAEFADYKEYAPGDELRHLDWKAYGKFDKYYVKRFEHETNLRAVMVVDASGSMGFGTTGLTKFDAARVLAASLSHLLVRQQDAAGVALISAGRFAEVPPRAAATHLTTVLDALETATPGGATDLAAAADTLAEKLPRRSLVCVFSDFLDENDQALKRVQNGGAGDDWFGKALLGHQVR